MLIGFSVKNFKSFDNPQSISFLASKIIRHKNHTVLLGNKRLLKSAVVYGANASGKTNLIDAIRFSRGVVLLGLDNLILTNNHFRMRKLNYGLPAVFDYRFILNGNEYSYGIALSYKKCEILSEWLIRIDDKDKEFVIFDRNVGRNNKSIVKTDIKEDNIENQKYKLYLDDFRDISESFRKKTILSDIALRTNEKSGVLGEIYNLFQCFVRILIIYPESKYNLVNEIATKNTTKLFFQNLLHYFDTGIDSITSQTKSFDFDKLLNRFPDEERMNLQIRIANDVKKNDILLRIKGHAIRLRKDKEGNIVYNKLQLNHGNVKDYFEYSDESDGTKRLFDLVPILNDENLNRIIIIDEIDRSLHTNLVRRFFELYFNLSENTESQLLATTHDSNIMDLDLLRQDEIWFIEREEDHSSKIYSLNKFKERFDKIVRNEYLIGRYGAIPIFRGQIEALRNE